MSTSAPVVSTADEQGSVNQIPHLNNAAPAATGPILFDLRWPRGLEIDKADGCPSENFGPDHSPFIPCDLDYTTFLSQEDLSFLHGEEFIDIQGSLDCTSINPFQGNLSYLEPIPFILGSDPSNSSETHGSSPQMPNIFSTVAERALQGDPDAIMQTFTEPGRQSSLYCSTPEVLAHSYFPQSRACFRQDQYWVPTHFSPAPLPPQHLSASGYSTQSRPASISASSTDHPQYLSPPDAAARSPESSLDGSYATDYQPAAQSEVSDSSSPSTSELQQYGSYIGSGRWKCAYPGCQSPAEFKRGCDLRKHFKRHSKTMFCRHPGCPQATKGGFSSKKDRGRHEAKHNPTIECAWEGCDRKFSRVDNMVWSPPSMFLQSRNLCLGGWRLRTLVLC
ncbi:MAG: hypothetical protein M1819_006409 [Sarea resinae]|nr:MAG: hypothetical protein M1819_006409 [Sarea resinae]